MYDEQISLLTVTGSDRCLCQLKDYISVLLRKMRFSTSLLYHRKLTHFSEQLFNFKTNKKYKCKTGIRCEEVIFCYVFFFC